MGNDWKEQLKKMSGRMKRTPKTSVGARLRTRRHQIVRLFTDIDRVLNAAKDVVRVNKGDLDIMQSKIAVGTKCPGSKEVELVEAMILDLEAAVAQLRERFSPVMLADVDEDDIPQSLLDDANKLKAEVQGLQEEQALYLKSLAQVIEEKRQLVHSALDAGREIIGIESEYIDRAVMLVSRANRELVSIDGTLSVMRAGEVMFGKQETPMSAVDYEHNLRIGIEQLKDVLTHFGITQTALSEIAQDIPADLPNLIDEVNKATENLSMIVSYVRELKGRREDFKKLDCIIKDGRMLEMLSDEAQQHLRNLHDALKSFIDYVEQYVGDAEKIEDLLSQPDEHRAEVKEKAIGLHSTIGQYYRDNPNEPSNVDKYYDLFKSFLSLLDYPPKTVEKEGYYSMWCGSWSNKDKGPICMKDGDELKYLYCTRLTDPLELESMSLPQPIKTGMVDIDDGEFCNRFGAKLPQDLSGHAKDAFHLAMTGVTILPTSSSRFGYKVKQKRNGDGDGESLELRTQGQLILASLNPDVVTDGQLLGSGGHYKAYVFGNKTVVEFDQEAHGTYFFDTEYFTTLREWSRSEILTEKPEGFYRRIIHPKGKWDLWRDRVEEFITAPQES